MRDGCHFKECRVFRPRKVRQPIFLSGHSRSGKRQWRLVLVVSILVDVERLAVDLVGVVVAVLILVAALLHRDARPVVTTILVFLTL